MNNEHMYTEKSNTNNRIKLSKILIIILIVIISICIAIFSYYKLNIDISNKYEQYFDYDLRQEYDGSYKIEDFIGYDKEKDPNTLFISIPKSYIYKNIVKIDELNVLYNNDYDLNINRIGTVLDKNNSNLINYYIDCTYKEFINTLIYGDIRYEINDNNELFIYFETINIGNNLPKKLYDKYLPIHDGDLIYKLNSDNYDLLSNDIFKLKLISNLDINKDNLTFNYDIVTNVKELFKDTFNLDSKFANSIIESLIPIVINNLIDSINGQ